MLDPHFHVGDEELAALAAGVLADGETQSGHDQAVLRARATHRDHLAVEVLVLDFGARLALEIVFDADWGRAWNSVAHAVLQISGGDVIGVISKFKT